MNKALIERNIAAVLFVLVLIAFSFAQHDIKKLEKFYSSQKIKDSKIALKTSVPVHSTTVAD